MARRVFFHDSTKGVPAFGCHRSIRLWRLRKFETSCESGDQSSSEARVQGIGQLGLLSGLAFSQHVCYDSH